METNYCNQTMIKKTLNWFCEQDKISLMITILGGVAILAISAIPGQAFSDYGGLNYKSILYHFFAFFCFTFFLLISTSKGKLKYNHIALSVIFSVLYAISDEIHQYFVPGRFMTASDIFTDTLGVAAATIIYLILISEKR